MDYMSMKQVGCAQAHLLTAWEIARPDDLIEGFGEHHGLLGGMLEAVLKPAWPENFKRIIDITCRFSAGWRRVHNPETGHDVPTISPPRSLPCARWRPGAGATRTLPST